jgi:hypothetical protein
MEPPRPCDRDGHPLRRGDVVRVVGVPDLAGVPPAGRRESLPVFRHLLGTYRTIAGFDAHGFAELFFAIRRGPRRGRHWVAIEPWLLRKRLPRRRP